VEVPHEAFHQQRRICFHDPQRHHELRSKSTTRSEQYGSTLQHRGDTVDVQHVIDAYHEALLTHDGSRLARLFLSQGGMWLNVLSDEAYARVQKRNHRMR
jgi:hypothetical protein